LKRGFFCFVARRFGARSRRVCYQAKADSTFHGADDGGSDVWFRAGARSGLIGQNEKIFYSNEEMPYLRSIH
jgi:hypothetical protein